MRHTLEVTRSLTRGGGFGEQVDGEQTGTAEPDVPVPDASVLVVAWNSAEDIAACVDAALAQSDGDFAVEVIVVDNASTDGTRLALEPYRRRVRLLFLERNTGYAEGNNAAVAVARGRHLLLVNPDCVLDAGAARALVGALEAAPALGAVAALLRSPDGSAQLFARRDPTLKVALWAFTATGVWVDARFLGRRHHRHRVYADSWPLAADVDVDCPAAAAVALPRSLAGPSGQLFDPALPLLFNDAALYRRLRHECYAVRIVPAATAAHGYGRGLEQVGHDRMRAETVASLQAYVTPAWGGFRRAVLTTGLLVDVALAVLLVAFLRGPGRATALLTIRGTLGGLGLPGGVRPWLARPPSVRHRVRRWLSRTKDLPRRWAIAGSRRVRRRTFLVRLRVAAWLSRCDVTAAVDSSADLARGIRIELPLGGRARLEVGPRVRIQRHAVLRLGGHLSLGERADIREGAVLTVNGRLDLGARVMVGRGTMVHADGDMTWEWGAVASEYVSVLDSSHVMDGSLVHLHDLPTVTRPVRLGASCLVGARSVVLPGVHVGRSAMVGAGSVVTSDVPAASVASGVPARVRRAVVQGS